MITAYEEDNALPLILSFPRPFLGTRFKLEHSVISEGREGAGADGTRTSPYTWHVKYPSRYACMHDIYLLTYLHKYIHCTSILIVHVDNQRVERKQL